MTSTQGPLRGVRVVEFRGIGPAPFATMLLADMGAEVVLIEPPGTAPPMAAMWRGRARMTLDLKSPGATERALEVLAHADVLVEGFRPGVMERLGLGPDVCHARNPRLVYGRMTGWGQDGPLAHAPSHDPNCLALTGALHSMGYPDRPPLPPLNLVADLGGGALYLAMGVLAALLHVRAGGEGQVVDAAMVDGVASLMGMVTAMRAEGGWSDERGVNFLDGSCPFGTSYETSDGKYMLVASIEAPFYARLLDTLGMAEADLPDQHDRARWPELRRRFAEVFATRTRDEWAERFADGGACVSPVLDLPEAAAHPHNRARGLFRDGDLMPAAAPRFDRTPTGRAPAQTEPAADVLARWAAPR